MVNVRDSYDRFVDAGGTVAIVSMAQPNQAAAFRAKYDLPFPLLEDPQLVAYQAFGLERGKLTDVAGPGIWKAGFKALIDFGLGVPKGDAYQLGGVFIVDSTGQVRYAHRSSDSADLPTNDELIAVLQTL